MDIKTILELAGFLLVLFGGFWKLNANIQKQFAAQIKAQVESYHIIDKQLDAISITVSPYAKDISDLKAQQNVNSMDKIQLQAELKAQKDTSDRQQKQIDAIQSQMASLRK